MHSSRDKVYSIGKIEEGLVLVELTFIVDRDRINKVTINKQQMP